MTVVNHIECRCGQVFGVACGKVIEGARYARLVRWVPDYLRGTAEAAGSKRGLSESLLVDAEHIGALSEALGEWLTTTDLDAAAVAGAREWTAEVAS